MKRKKTKLAAPSLPIPQSIDEANAHIRSIGQINRDITRIEAAMNDELAAVRERFEAQAMPLRQQEEALKRGLNVWAEANREALTQGGKTKTALFAAGEISWRLRPPSVRVTGQDAVLHALRTLGLARFIRVKEEVNKEAILNEPEAVTRVPGITISQGEDFIVAPFETELCEQAA